MIYQNKIHCEKKGYQDRKKRVPKGKKGVPNRKKKGTK